MHLPPSTRRDALPRRAGGLAAALGLALLLSVAAPARADVPLELRGRRVLGVEIEGATAGLVSARELGVPIGARLSRALVRAAVQRLVRSGRWTDVQVDAVPEADGVRLVARLVPRLLVARIEITGNDVIDDDEVLRTLGLSVGAELQLDRVSSLVRPLEAAYAERGYQRARVRLATLETDDPFTKVVVVQIVEGPATRVVGVQFVGRVPRSLDLGAVLGVDVGDVLDRRRLEEIVRGAEQEVRRRGYYDARLDPPSVVPRAGGVVVQVHVSIGPHFTLRVRGNAPLPRADVEDALALGSEWLGSTSARQSVQDRVVELYRKNGFLDATARVSTEPVGADADDAVLAVDVRPGPQVQVVSITFPGSTFFRDGLLRDQVYAYLEEDLPGSTLLFPVDSEVVDELGVGGAGRGRARSVPRPLVVEPRRTYYGPTYDEAVEHIAELYQADGFLGVRVGPARLERLDPHRARVVIPVVEGPRSMLFRIVLRGNEVLTDHDVGEVLALRAGAPFGHLVLEEARLRVLERYRELGYLYASIEPEVRFSQDRTRAEVTLRVTERFPVQVGAIEIRGANRTSHALVRERLSFDEGDLFRPSALRESQDRLLELGIFGGVTIAPEEADLPARVKNVVITVTERPAQLLDVTAGISTGEGLRAGFEYGYRNLFGYAVGISLRAQFAYQFLFVEDVLQDRFDALSVGDRLERSITLGLTVPNVWRLRGLRVSLDLAHVRDNERDFGFDKNGVSLTLAWRPTKRLAFSAAENLENNNVALFVGSNLDDYLREVTDPRLQRLLRVPEGESTLVETRTTAALDLRDSPFTPTRGAFVSVAADWARTLRTERLGGDVAPEQFVSDFVKLSVTGSAYVPLSDRVVLAAQVRFGRVFHLDTSSKTYPNRRFFLGGMDTLRGYLQDALVPQDIANRIAIDPDLDPNDIVRGGDAFLLLRGELRFPILGELQGGIFADVGNLWADAAQLDPWELRPTAGVGLRLGTPVGPLAFDYGVVLARRDALREPFGAFHFSIGLF